MILLVPANKITQLNVEIKRRTISLTGLSETINPQLPIIRLSRDFDEFLREIAADRFMMSSSYGHNSRSNPRPA
jgi:hypothetical protein